MIEDYEGVEKSLKFSSGEGIAIDIESERSGVPLLVDTAAVDRLVVYSTESMSDSLSAGGSAGSACLISRSESNNLDTYCLYLKERVSILAEPSRSDHSVDLMLSFDKGYNPVGFVGVCPPRKVHWKVSARADGAGGSANGQKIHWTIR